jgi:hypothetical protein
MSNNNNKNILKIDEVDYDICHKINNQRILLTELVRKLTEENDQLKKKIIELNLLNKLLQETISDGLSDFSGDE